MTVETGERLQKVLAHAGVASRRAAEELIVAGRVRVNGTRAHLGQRVDPIKDEVEVDGSPVPVAPGLRHYLLNKPTGTVTTTDDEHGRPTVMDLIGEEGRLWPVGRLDIDTEGALIVTNDGELTNRLTHPRYGITKTYLAEVTGRVTRSDVRRLVTGVVLEDGLAVARRAVVVESTADATLVELEMGEGRHREVRRMFEALGYRVARLARVAIGPVVVGRLKPGTYRKLTQGEIRTLYAAARTEGVHVDKSTDRQGPRKRNPRSRAKRDK
jgi:23S rRNA pseudouridine2605 synthase